MFTLHQSLWIYFPSLLPTLSPWMMLWSCTVVSGTTGHQTDDIYSARPQFTSICCQMWYFTNTFWQHLYIIPPYNSFRDPFFFYLNRDQQQNISPFSLKFKLRNIFLKICFSVRFDCALFPLMEILRVQRR